MEVIPGNIYVNKKNKQLYKVIVIGTHTEELIQMVHYVPLYAAPPQWKNCFRPLDLFKEKFIEL